MCMQANESVRSGTIDRCVHDRLLRVKKGVFYLFQPLLPFVKTKEPERLPLDPSHIFGKGNEEFGKDALHLIADINPIIDQTKTRLRPWRRGPPHLDNLSAPSQQRQIVSLRPFTQLIQSFSVHMSV